jgi:hypothetical protein
VPTGCPPDGVVGVAVFSFRAEGLLPRDPWVPELLAWVFVERDLDRGVEGEVDLRERPSLEWGAPPGVEAACVVEGVWSPPPHPEIAIATSSASRVIGPCFLWFPTVRPTR